MSELPDKLTDDAISAWVEDIKEEDPKDIRNPLLEVDIIPLACVWSLANSRLVGRVGSCFQFTQDVMAHDGFSELWRERAERAGDVNVQFETFSFERRLEILEHGGIDPLRFEFMALTDGRPEGQETISGVEMSVIWALGHAAYNSTSGTPMLLLNPLGPAEWEPWAFMRLADEYVKRFVEEKI
jgi:hypothetical protein